jgi:mono/diheme cytochrome c family protein
MDRGRQAPGRRRLAVHDVHPAGGPLEAGEPAQISSQSAWAEGPSRSYFAKKDPEVLRRDVWHMLADGSPQMPPMNRVLRPSEVREILAWLRTLPRS